MNKKIQYPVSIQVKAFEFAVRVVEICKDIARDHQEYVLSEQFLRSGTSIGANAEEAAGGSSKKDFRAKLSIAYKEARETKYWLKLLHRTGYINDDQFQEMGLGCEELLKNPLHNHQEH